MKSPSTGIIAIGAVAFAAVLLVAIGAPHDREAPAAIAPPSAVPPPSSVTARGFTLSSTSIDLPVDGAGFPAGPHADLINANCTACHSASMATGQPAMSAEQWKATVTKMREVYKAPVAQADIDPIVAYLVAMPGQRAAAPTGKAQDPAPGAKPDITAHTG